jgi:hypothetical protein
MTNNSFRRRLAFDRKGRLAGISLEETFKFSTSALQRVPPFEVGSSVHVAWNEAFIVIPGSITASVTGFEGLQSFSEASYRWPTNPYSHVSCSKG